MIAKYLSEVMYEEMFVDKGTEGIFVRTYVRSLQYSDFLLVCKHTYIPIYVLNIESANFNSLQ